MYSLSKEQSILSRKTIFKKMPLFLLGKSLMFCNISVINKDIYLKLRVSVYYTKSNLYYKGKQYKMHYFKDYAPFST